MKKSRTQKIFRVKKTNNFIIISRYLTQDQRLSLEARGLLMYLLSMPDDWIISISQLIKISSAKRDKIRRIIKELIFFNYIIKVEQRGERGQFLNPHYFVYEFPTDGHFDHLNENNHAVNSSPVNPLVENPPQQSTKKKQIINKTTTKSTFIFPSKLSNEHQDSILSLLDGISKEPGQMLLDELAGNINTAKNPVGYFHSLLKSYRSGNLIPSKSIDIKSHRERALKNDQLIEQSRKNVEKQHLANMKKYLEKIND